MQPGSYGQSPPIKDGTPVQFDANSATRIDRVVRYVEGISRGGAPLRGSGNRPGLITSYQCKTTSTVSARSGATLGTGTARICSVDGSDNLVDDGEPLTVKSQFTSTIASGVYITVIWSSGVWLIDIAPCA